MGVATYTNAGHHNCFLDRCLGMAKPCRRPMVTGYIVQGRTARHCSVVEAGTHLPTGPFTSKLVLRKLCTRIVACARQRADVMR